MNRLVVERKRQKQELLDKIEREGRAEVSAQQRRVQAVQEEIAEVKRKYRQQLTNIDAVASIRGVGGQGQYYNNPINQRMLQDLEVAYRRKMNELSRKLESEQHRLKGIYESIQWKKERVLVQ